MESRKNRFWDFPTFRRSKEADMKKLEYILVKGRNFPTQPLRAKVNDTQWSQINHSLLKFQSIYKTSFNNKLGNLIFQKWIMHNILDCKKHLGFPNNFRMEFPILFHCVILWEGSTCCNTDIDTFFKGFIIFAMQSSYDPIYMRLKY